MFWGDGSAEAMAAVNDALMHVRDTANFNWTFIALLAFVLCGCYVPRIRDRRWDAIFAALALYGTHWIYEIANAVICRFAGYGLWHVTPSSTTFILLIGVSWELSMMFSIAGFLCELLPADKDLKICGVNNRILFAVGNALFFSVFEIFLAATPSFVWVWKWWGALPVFVTTYIPFFLACFLTYDLPRKQQIRVVGTMWAVVALLLVTLIPAGII